jgi:hypothetical protein
MPQKTLKKAALPKSLCSPGFGGFAQNGLTPLTLPSASGPVPVAI